MAVTPVSSELHILFVNFHHLGHPCLLLPTTPDHPLKTQGPLGLLFLRVWPLLPFLGSFTFYTQISHHVGHPRLKIIVFLAPGALIFEGVAVTPVSCELDVLYTRSTCENNYFFNVCQVMRERGDPGCYSGLLPTRPPNQNTRPPGLLSLRVWPLLPFLLRFSSTPRLGFEGSYTHVCSLALLFCRSQAQASRFCWPPHCALLLQPRRCPAVVAN